MLSAKKTCALWLFCLSSAFTIRCPVSAEEPRLQTAAAPLKISVESSAKGLPEWHWMQARTAYIAAPVPRWLTVMNQYDRAATASHAFFDVYAITLNDRNGQWSEPVRLPSLARAKTTAGDENVPSDLWPLYHPQTGTVLITGKVFHFDGGTKENILREQVGYAVYDPETDTCGPLQIMKMPEQDHQGRPILAPNAGCHQAVLLENGDLLLPVRFQSDPKKRIYTSVVARCRYDGKQLTYVEHGSEHSIPTGRGLYEPSVGEFNGKYFLTLRADGNGHVASGDDGIHFNQDIAWTFDDGSELGSVHTQQHWMPIGGKLYLVYTRKGANNDHIMRARAPLFTAQVDPERLCVIRETEQIVLPERGTTTGNFGICRVSDTESWVTCAEWRIPEGRTYNNVWVARVRSE